MMKILSIGNSFSHDAHVWLHSYAEKLGYDITTANLYIGGCSLETHWSNFENNTPSYDLEINGGTGESKISIPDALLMDNWDVITLQQASGFSGMFESYEPFLSNLAKAVRIACPDSALYFHQTWAYETDSCHEHFSFYSNEQKKMFEAIKASSLSASSVMKAPIIRSGEVIQALRERVDFFDYSKTGRSLCRDGYHMSLDFGRFALAAVWIATLTQNKIDCVEFEDFNPLVLSQILDIVNMIVFDK